MLRIWITYILVANYKPTNESNNKKRFQKKIKFEWAINLSFKHKALF